MLPEWRFTTAFGSDIAPTGKLEYFVLKKKVLNFSEMLLTLNSIVTAFDAVPVIENL